MTAGIGVEGHLEAIAAGSGQSVYLVGGDAVLSEPAALRIARVLARAFETEPVVYRRPARLRPVLDDLRTHSLFATGKVLVVVDCALFADRNSAADLIDQSGEVLPVEEGSTLSNKEREAAGRLMQALRLFGVDPRAGDPSAALDHLPEWALQGGRTLRKKKNGRGRTKKQVEELSEGLSKLLGAARELELVGWGENDLAALGDLLDRGLPERHALVFSESHWARDHPTVARLTKLGAMVDVGGLRLDRRGSVEGLEALGAELERETGVAIQPAALQELARRTIRKSNQRGRYDMIEAESTARLAAEYRKLVGLAGDGPVDVDLVKSTVRDRGQEDVWALLDDLAAGDMAAALQRLRRIEDAAEDAIASRLSLFSLLADYCRQLAAVRGLLGVQRVPAGERNYNRFKNQWAPALQAPLADGLDNPVARLHPYRLHRVYLAASRLDDESLRGLPARVLETEARLKGESGEPATALTALMAALSADESSAKGRSRR